ncbi:hypothetical protein [Pontibacter ruber]|uniref:SIR2-like domain-containing protein n=1 Tax=Pontibacter ruber TaxID=1343895 RepID=A0ABW5CYE5_9BACT|nr:hypothetical protein [Pontibacter ruber]
MKVVCFIGSGFNYMLADIVKPQTDLTIGNITLYEELISLNNLWQEFDYPLLQLGSFIPDRRGERMLEAVENIQSILQKSSTIGNKINSTDQSPHAILDIFIKEHIQRVGERFTKFEENGGYSKINRVFSNFGAAFTSILQKNHISEFYLCSTNYDGIVDSLLTYYCKHEMKRKFILKDGFINEDFYCDLFRRYNYKIAHIHGSYRYFDGPNRTIKVGKAIVNEKPLMIYGNPYRKESSILNNHVLKVNYLELKRLLSSCDKVVAIGNSFNDEPHLLDLLRSTFNRPETQMIVCSDKPHVVASVLEPYYGYTIHTQSTKHVQSEEQLIKLFSKLLSSTSMNMLATA